MQPLTGVLLVRRTGDCHAGGHPHSQSSLNANALLSHLPMEGKKDTKPKKKHPYLNT